MRSQLRLAPHTQRRGEQVVEIWYDGEFIGQVTGLDGPGFRLISKYIGDAAQGPLITVSAHETIDVRIKGDTR